MRRSLLALGIVLLFMGLVFISVSRTVVKPEPLQKWLTVEEVEVEEEQSTGVVFLNGYLTQGDRFRVHFSLGPSPGPFVSVDASVLVNLTDPTGHVQTYVTGVGPADGSSLVIKEQFPEGVADVTGTYKVKALPILVILRHLALQKMELEEKEPQYPYVAFLPVGFAVLLGGVGTSLLGVKISKRRRKRYKSPSPKRKG